VLDSSLLDFELFNLCIKFVTLNCLSGDIISSDVEFLYLFVKLLRFGVCIFWLWFDKWLLIESWFKWGFFLFKIEIWLFGDIEFIFTSRLDPKLFSYCRSWSLRSCFKSFNWLFNFEDLLLISKKSFKFFPFGFWIF